jgi:FMN phosphatase YigB (HAD superfamily)
MRLDSLSALTFDCYGTLIDWKVSILAALRPWAVARVTAGDEELLAAFAQAESRREAAEPTAPYPGILVGGAAMGAQGAQVGQPALLRPAAVRPWGHMEELDLRGWRGSRLGLLGTVRSVLARRIKEQNAAP